MDASKASPPPQRMTSTELLITASVIVAELSGEYPALTVKVDHYDSPHVGLWLSPDQSSSKERRKLITDVSRTFGAAVTGWETNVASVYAWNWNGTGVLVSCLCRIDNGTEEAEVPR